MALRGGGVSPEQPPGPRAARVGLQGPEAPSPQRHKKEDLRQVEGDVNPEAGLEEGGDGLCGEGRGRHTHTPALAPAPGPALSLLPSGPHPSRPIQVSALLLPRRSWGWKKRERGEGGMGRRGGGVGEPWTHPARC